MFQKFKDAFFVSKDYVEFGKDLNFSKQSNKDSAVFVELFDSLGGRSYDADLFRVHSFGSSSYWTKVTTNFYKEYEDKVICFAFDWLGRQFAVDLTGKEIIYMFDPATFEVFQLDCSLTEFFELELVEYKEETLALPEYKEWKKKNEAILDFNQCVGFKTPLSLGGKDSVSNYEIYQMDFYWELNRQLSNKIKDLPEGASLERLLQKVCQSKRAKNL